VDRPLTNLAGKTVRIKGQVGVVIEDRRHKDGSGARVALMIQFRGQVGYSYLNKYEIGDYRYA
jgi:hypothetical protein